MLSTLLALPAVKEGAKAAFTAWKKDYEFRISQMNDQAIYASEKLDHLFAFCESVFPDGQQQLLILSKRRLSLSIF